MNACLRCGWFAGSGREHLCHRCEKKPGKSRFYTPSMNFSLSGMQMKLSVKETFGCDECWAEFQKEAESQKSSREEAPRGPTDPACPTE